MSHVDIAYRTRITHTRLLAHQARTHTKHARTLSTHARTHTDMLAHMRKSEEEIGIGKESKRYGLRQALVSARVYSAVPPVFHRDSGQQDVAGGQAGDTMLR